MTWHHVAGAIYIGDNTNLYLNDSTFHENIVGPSAVATGGAIAGTFGTASIFNARFMNNYCNFAGQMSIQMTCTAIAD